MGRRTGKLRVVATGFAYDTFTTGWLMRCDPTVGGDSCRLVRID